MARIKKRMEFKNTDNFMQYTQKKVDIPYNANINRYLKIRQQLAEELMEDIDTICRANYGLMRIGVATDNDYADKVFIADCYHADEVVRFVSVNKSGEIEVETDRGVHKLTELDCEELLHLYDTMMVCNENPEYMEIN